MKELNLRCIYVESDFVAIQEDTEAGGFGLKIKSGQESAEIYLTHHMAKKIQAFINQNSRKGGRNR